MDNASFHKRLDILYVRMVIFFLPPYSPDLNPIEHKWAQDKAIRKQEHCSITELFAKYKI